MAAIAYSRGMARWTFYIETYGCRVNQHETQIIREAWRAAGGEERAAPAEADYVIINGCAITSRAERDARNAVYRARRAAPAAKIILAGCAAQFFGDFRPRKKANYSAPDLALPQAAKPTLLAGPSCLDGPRNTGNLWGVAAFQRSRPVIKIQDGCASSCAYCVVPQTRGKPVSRPPAEILAECRRLLDQGFGELVISGINMRQYGYDNPAHGCLTDLLTFLDRELKPDYAGKCRLRLSSLDPGQLEGKGLEELLSLSLICPHLHLSLQHSSPAILSAMRRAPLNKKGLLAAIQALRAKRGLLGLGADLLVGFPGETEMDLGELLDFISELGLTYAHVFPFSSRPGTVAASLPGQIPKNEKLARALLVRERIAAGKRDFLKLQLGLKETMVVPDHADHGARSRGVNEYYSTCVFPAPSCLQSTRLIRMAPDHLEGDAIFCRPV